MAGFPSATPLRLLQDWWIQDLGGLGPCNSIGTDTFNSKARVLVGRLPILSQGTRLKTTDCQCTSARIRVSGKAGTLICPIGPLESSPRVPINCKLGLGSFAYALVRLKIFIKPGQSLPQLSFMPRWHRTVWLRTTEAAST